MVSEAFGPHLGYLAVLIGTLLEGEAVLFLAGLAAQHGYLSFPIVAAIGAFGGFVADQSLFFIGRRFGNRLLVRFPSVAARAARVQTLVQRWDVLAVVLVRFLYGLRIAGPIVIGSCRIAVWRLVLFNIIGAVIWAFLVAGIGYFAGQAVQQWFGRLPHTQVLLLMAAVLAVMLVSIVIAWRRRRLRRSPSGHRSC
jgi:membrane protein DedA with SNARE-associated domain